MEEKEIRCAKTPLLRKAKKRVGSIKTPTETPAGVTKTGAVVLKPRLKDGLVFGKTPVGGLKTGSVLLKPRPKAGSVFWKTQVGVWTTGSALLKTGLVFFKKPACENF